jgi:hypothetical protein
MVKRVLISSLLILSVSVTAALAGSAYKVPTPPPGTYVPLPPPGDTRTQGEFFRCSMGRCLQPRVDDPRGGIGDPGEASFANRRSAIVQLIQMQCGGQPMARAQACAMQVCAQNAPQGLTPPQIGQYCSTLAGSAFR